MTEPTYERDNDLALLAGNYAWSFIGIPYRWGGDDPSGFDCSGLAVEVLQGVGLFDRKADDNANGLFHRFPSVEKPHRGCLAFWGRRDDSRLRATHVEIVVKTRDAQTWTVGASGGGSKTKTEADAWRQNAFVKLRPVHGPGARADFLGYCDPFKE
jgi:hypothetical protein